MTGRLFAQRFSNRGINRNDFVPMRLHISRNPVAQTHRPVGKPDYSNGFRALQQLADGISFRTGDHSRILACAATLCRGLPFV